VQSFVCRGREKGGIDRSFIISMSASVAVLIVEPSLEERERISSTLRRLGITANVVDTFEKARHAVTTEPPDVLVTEVRLGAYNGLHLVLRAKMLNPSLRAIVVSGGADPVLQREAIAIGAEFSVKEGAWLASIMSMFPVK
jgi:DNA-binding NtrC family response regulator